MLAHSAAHPYGSAMPPVHSRSPRWLRLLILPLRGAACVARAPGPTPVVGPDSGDVIAIRDVWLWDGVMRTSRDGMTVVVAGDRIAAVGPTAGVAVPEGAR